MLDEEVLIQADFREKEQRRERAVLVPIRTHQQAQRLFAQITGGKFPRCTPDRHGIFLRDFEMIGQLGRSGILVIHGSAFDPKQPDREFGAVMDHGEAIASQRFAIGQTRVADVFEAVEAAGGRGDRPEAFSAGVAVQELLDAA